MIYLFDGNRARPLKESCQTLNGLKSKFPNASISNEDELSKCVSKHKDVYIYIDPYNSEIKDSSDDKDLICWSTYLETAKHNFYLSSEEI